MQRQRYRFIWLLARRDLLDELKITLIVVSMLGFSFLNLAFFPAFVDGLSEAFTSDLVDTQTGHVSITAEEGLLENPDGIAQKVARMEEVVLVEKRLEFNARIVHGNSSVNTQVIGTSALDAETYTSRMEDGRFLTRGDDDRLVLGALIAQEDEEGFGTDALGVDAGRTVTMSVNGQRRDFQVKGTIGKPGPSALPRQAFVTFDTAKELLGEEERASSVHVLIEDKDDAAAFKQRLQQLNTRGVIQTWDEQSDVADAVTGTFSVVVAIIAAVGLVIAITSIGVVIFINTNKRAREMGIIKSIGAENRIVVSIFLLEAVLFALIGIGIGNALMIIIDTYLAANPIPTPIGALRTIVTPNLLLGRSAWMLAAAVIAGLLPAYITSKRSIVDTIEER